MSKTECQVIYSNCYRNIQKECPIKLKTSSGDSATEPFKIAQMFKTVYIDSIRGLVDRINFYQNKYTPLNEINNKTIILIPTDENEIKYHLKEI